MFSGISPSLLDLFQAEVKEKSTIMSRRGFFVGSAATGLVIGFTTIQGRFAAASDTGTLGALYPNAFLRVGTDNIITVIAKHFEMGQGTMTGLATLVAEELDADWEKVRVEWAPANAELYKNLAWGIQGTGGSSAIANSYQQYRQAGAIARDLLMRSAAKNWNVPVQRLMTEASIVIDPDTGKRLSYGALTGIAAGLVPAETVTVKDKANFRLIGQPKEKVPRQDSFAKTNGRAVFSMDVRRPGMVTAVVARAPKFGGTVKSYDARDALRVRGVKELVQIPTGVAVLAENSWAAIKGRDALKIEWDFSTAETRDSETIIAEYSALAKKPGQMAHTQGNLDTGFSNATQQVEAEFIFPYLAHAPMEPLNCVIEFTQGRCDIWAGSQMPTIEQATAAGILGLKPEQVFIHTVYAGGSFGRRATPTADYIAEAAMLAKAVDGKMPIHLIQTREDDIKGGYYRPAYVHRVKAAIDETGKPVAWHHRVVGQSILSGTPFAGLIKDGIDYTSVEGASNLPYAIPNMKVELHTTEVGVPILWWRSVGHSHTAYSTEIIIDELAAKAGQDPLAYRLALLGDHRRHAGVLRLVAEKAGWDQPLPKNQARGIAVHESFNSYAAHVVHVSQSDAGLKIERVDCAIDCGQIINPDVVTAQIEGGIGYALGAVLRNEITLQGGEIVQSNFPDYEPLRISDMPPIKVHMVASDADPTGVGEPGVPPLAPALANAIRALTGQALYTLPFTKSNLSFV